MSEVDTEYTAEPLAEEPPVAESEEPQKIPVMPEPVVYNYKIALADDKDPFMKVLAECAQLGKHGFRIAHVIQTGKKFHIVMEQKLFLVPDQKPGGGILVPR